MSNLEWLWGKKAIQSEREGKSFKENKNILKYIEKVKEMEKRNFCCVSKKA